MSSALGRDPFSRPLESERSTVGTADKPTVKSTSTPPSQPSAVNTRKSSGDKKESTAKTKRAKVVKTAKTVKTVKTTKTKAPQRSPSRIATQPRLAAKESSQAVAAEIDRQELFSPSESQVRVIKQLVNLVTKYFSPFTYGARLGQMGMFWHSEEIGPFGFDPVFWRNVKPFFQFLFDKYWRIELNGTENIPREGRALLVANHSGCLPWDGIMLRLAVANQGEDFRPIHFLVEDFVFHFPFLGPFINRVGGVRACQDNAARLLQTENLVGVFPEGAKGIGKLYEKRYQLQRFGRGGFVRLAQRTQSPIIPVAIVGAEEIHPMLANFAWLAKNLGLPYLPITPTFPWLGPLGLLPLPSKWLIRFGKPIVFDQAYDEHSTMEKAEQVRSTIQHMMDDLLHQRKNPFLGQVNHNS